MMKIALVVPGGVDRSGTDRVIPCLLWLIERLAAAHEVHVFALRQEARPGHWPLLGAEVHDAGARPRRARALAQMLAEHRRERFDVVHGFWAAGPGVVAVTFGRLTGVPAIVSLPGGDLTALDDIGYGALLTRRGRWWTRFALAGAACVVVPCKHMAVAAAAFGIGAETIPFGVALDRWSVRAVGERTGALRLVHVANLNRVKDQETLLAAARLLAEDGVDFGLDVIGLDTLGGAVQRRCTELGLSDRVRFHGFLTHDAVRPWIERAHVLVMSSRHEAGPMVMLEAAVAGVPTIGTAVGHVADWAPGAAVAVPIGDAEALAAAVVGLADDEPERLRLAAAAQMRALACDADMTARLHQELYARVRHAGRVPASAVEAK